MSPEAVRRTTASEVGTVALGRRLAAGLRPGDLLALHGELGAGKTCLVRGLAAGLGCDPAAVRSPTFVLHHVYPSPRATLHHLDLYRLGDGADVSVLDLDGLLAGGIVAVEWAELADLADLDPVHVRLGWVDRRHRTVELDGGAPARLISAFMSSGTKT